MKVIYKSQKKHNQKASCQNQTHIKRKRPQNNSKRRDIDFRFRASRKKRKFQKE
jgi:hypothetical protein